MQNLGQHFSDAVGKIVGGLPALIGAVVILIVGYIIAKVLQTLTRRGLEKTSLDESLKRSAGGQWIERISPQPSNGIARVVYWVVMIGVISWAVSTLGIPALSLIVAGFYRYLPNILAAFLIFLGAGAISAGVAGLINRTMGDTETGKLLGALTPGVIMAIAIFAILNQLKIASAIVTITYAAILGAVALSAALAFGLGGREVASRLLDQAYERGQDRLTQARDDLALGRERAGQLAEQVKQPASERPTRRRMAAEPVFGETRQSVQPADSPEPDTAVSPDDDYEDL